MLADIKHVLWSNPQRPALYPVTPETHVAAPDLEWLAVDEGVQHIGHGTQAFAFHHERPRHRVFLEPFRIASRLVTNGEYREFVRCGGYRQPELWLAKVGRCSTSRSGKHPCTGKAPAMAGRLAVT